MSLTDSRTLSVVHSAQLARYREPKTARSVAQLVSTLAALALGWYLAWLSLRVSYALTLLWAIPTAGCVVRLFILQHDCGHGSFFKNRRANEVVGFFLGVLTMTPFQCWRRYHSIHHASSSNLDRRGWGDVRMLTVREYFGLTPFRRMVYRVYRSPIVLFSVGPFILFVLRQRFVYYVPKDWKRERTSVHLTNLAIFAGAVALMAAVGMKSFLAIQIPIMAVAGSSGVWLFYVQHQFESTYWRRHAEWDYVSAGLLGSSHYDLPVILRWFTADVGIHHIHHLDCKIPNYRLRECLTSNPELSSVPRLTFWSSLACASLKLWDEDAQRMVRLDSLCARPSASIAGG